MVAFPLAAPGPRAGTGALGGSCYRRGMHGAGGKAIAFTVNGNKPALCLGETLPHFSRLCAANTTLRNVLGEEQLGPGFLKNPTRACRTVRPGADRLSLGSSEQETSR